MLSIVQSMASTDKQQNRMFLKIALAMGATIGVSNLAFIYNTFIDFLPILTIIGNTCLFIQQCVIMSLFMCSKKMSQLCKAKIVPAETSS